MPYIITLRQLTTQFTALGGYALRQSAKVMRQSCAVRQSAKTKC
jgi:hypothetical protein